MSWAHIPQLPLSLSLLDGLTSLHLENFEGYLAQQVLGLALLPNLQELYFGFEYMVSREFDDREMIHMMIQQLEIMCMMHKPPLLRSDHEKGLDFDAYSLEGLSEQDKERAASLLSHAQELLALPQGGE